MGTQQTIDSDDFDKLLAERDFYKRILDKVPAVIHINNLETQLVDWINQYGLSLSGYPHDQVVQNPDFLPRVVVAEDLPWMFESIEWFKKPDSNSTSYIYNMRHADGKIATYQGFGVLFDTDKNGKPLRNLAIDIDITHDIQNYLQLKRHMDEMRRKLHQSQLDNLTITERQIVTQLCRGKSIKAIATEQNRSHYTIENHKRNIFNKLGFNKTSQLVTWGNEVGLAD
jgi:DNA-binding CsgD family transcriptional regulator